MDHQVIYSIIQHNNIVINKHKIMEKHIPYFSAYLQRLYLKGMSIVEFYNCSTY